MDATLVEKCCNFFGPIVLACNNFLVVVEAYIDVTLWRIAFFQQSLDSLDDAEQMTFHIQCASAPDKSPVVSTGKWWICPVVLSSRSNGNDILMRQKSNRIQGSIAAFPVQDQSGMTDFFYLQGRKSLRICVAQELMKFCKSRPIRIIFIFMGDRSDLNGAAEILGKTRFINILKLHIYHLIY